MTPDLLSRTVTDFLSEAAGAIVLEDGAVAFDLGQSKYSIRRLLRLNFDLMTGFSTLPLQFISWFGALLAIVGFAFGVFLFIRRLIHGPEVEGVFTLFAILFAFLGVQLFCLGLMGEYVGRIYSEVRHRPRFLIRRVREAREAWMGRTLRDAPSVRGDAPPPPGEGPPLRGEGPGRRASG